MATTTFRLIGTKSNNASIYVRFKQGNKFDTQVSTKIECPKDRWSATKQQILATELIDYKSINTKLKELSIYLNDEYEKTKIGTSIEIINNSWLNEKINIFFNRLELSNEIKEKLYFTEFIESFIEESHTKRNRLGNPIQPRTIQHYRTTFNKVVQFENHTNIKLKITDVNLKFHNSFIQFLQKQQLLNPNTIGGYIDDIKLFINNADNKNIEINSEVKMSEFYSPSNSTKDIYLTTNEINLIYNHKFDNESLDNVRDWFIIGLRTGLRISDFLKLTKKNIVDGYIQKKTIKTNFPVIIPIHKQVLEILNKRNNNFPNEISDQKFNEYIKKVCEKVGLTEMVEGSKLNKVPSNNKNSKKKHVFRKTAGMFPKHELVTSHICRRSFATNLYGKIDTLTIMKITGHKTESQFFSYIKITPKEYAEKLKIYWEKNQEVFFEPDKVA